MMITGTVKYVEGRDIALINVESANPPRRGEKEAKHEPEPKRGRGAAHTHPTHPAHPTHPTKEEEEKDKGEPGGEEKPLVLNVPPNAEIKKHTGEKGFLADVKNGDVVKIDGVRLLPHGEVKGEVRTLTFGPATPAE